MATKTHTAKRAVVQASKPRLSVMPEMANEDVDCLHIMEEAMKFFLRRAVEASDEKVAKKFARDAHRALKALARYHPLYNRLWRKGFDMRDLKQAEALLEVLVAVETTDGILRIRSGPSPRQSEG